MNIGKRSEAKRQGLTRYFTGKPCKHGHIAERKTSTGFCIECNRVWDRENFRSNPEKFHRKAQKRWQEKKEELGVKKKAWIAAHPEKNKEYCKKRYWRNPEKYRANGRAWKKKNPEKHIQSVLRNMHQRRVRIEASESYTQADIERILVAQNGKCAYCREPFKKKKYTIDHILALSRGGTNEASNIQLCCKKCNASKGARDSIYFAQSLGLLV